MSTSDSTPASAKAPARKKKTDKAAALNSERINTLVKQAELRAIHLIASDFKMSPEYLGAVMTGAEMDLKVHEEDPVLEYGGDGDTLLTVTVTWVVTGSSKDAPDALRVSVTYISAFEIGPGWQEDEVQYFGNRTGVMSIYPYFRSHINHLSAESGALIPVLPLRKTNPVRISGGFRSSQDTNDEEQNSGGVTPEN